MNGERLTFARNWKRQRGKGSGLWAIGLRGILKPARSRAVPQVEAAASEETTSNPLPKAILLAVNLSRPDASNSAKLVLL
jgi:hypothetical protein